MYNEKEKLFMDYWEANRLREKKWVRQFLLGIPIGLIFAIPILLNVFTGRFWYQRADAVAHTQMNPAIMIVAIVLITGFVAIFYKQHQWDRKEQYYQELKAREKNMGSGGEAEQR